MKFLKFLKFKTTYIILIFVVGGGIYIQHRRSVANTITYQTQVVVKETLQQTVAVTGEIKPSSRIELGFKRTGTLKNLRVHIGDVVQIGDVLAEIKADDLAYAVRSAESGLQIAQANYNVKAAGETAESIQVSEAAVSQAKALYEKALRDLEATKRTTVDSVQTADNTRATAENNLANANAIADQNVQNAYDAAKTQLLTALGPLQTGLTNGDTISGVDNTAASQLYGNVIGFLDSGSLDRAKNSYHIAKTARQDAESAVKAISSGASKDQILFAANAVQNAINVVQTYLTDIQKVLAVSITSSNFSSTDLANKKSTTDSDRTSVSAQSSAVLNVLQAIKNTELTRTQTMEQLQSAFTNAQTALQTAQTNADIAVHAGSTNIAIQKSAVDSAVALLSQKKAGPRIVDLASLSASVVQAQVVLDKARVDFKDAQIVTPVIGIISDILPHIGETVNVGSIVIKMVGNDTPEIEALIPEADIAKIALYQKAEMTLDAYGDDVKFQGSVGAKDPAETKVQDAVYYKVHILVDAGGKEVKPGMTANIIVHTGEIPQAFILPLRAVHTKPDGTKVVRLLVNGKPIETMITLGLRGDEGRVEAKTGLKEGDLVIVGEK